MPKLFFPRSLERYQGSAKVGLRSLGNVSWIACDLRRRNKTMNRANGLFDQISAWDNLLAAVHQASRGKRHRCDSQAFCLHLSGNLRRIQEELTTDRFQFGRFHQFVIHDPKRRIITAPCFEERVVHHAIINVCEPVFERFLINDSFVCGRGLGRLVSQIVIPMPHQPQRDSVRFRQKPRASAQRLILRKDYVELNFQFLTLAALQRAQTTYAWQSWLRFLASLT